MNECVKLNARIEAEHEHFCGKTNKSDELFIVTAIRMLGENLHCDSSRTYH